MTSNDKVARLAGLLYLLLLPTTGLWFGSWAPLVTSDPGAALAHIQASRTFFESTLVAGAIGYVDYLVLAIVLYRLFSPIEKSVTGLLILFMAASVPLALAAIARQMDVLSVLDLSHRLPALTGDQVTIHATLALQGFNNLFLLTDIFSGLWLLPLAWLGVRSGLLPRTLGVLLILGGVFYLLSFVGTVFDPNFVNTLVGRIVGIATGIPGVLGELATGLWLLIRGAGARQSSVG